MRFFVYVTLIAALLVSFVPAQAMLAATVVTPASPNGWMAVDDNGWGGGLADFVTGPGTPPLGTGSGHLVLQNNKAGWIFAKSLTPNAKLSQLTKLEYSTYVTANDLVQTLAVGINVDYNVDDTDNSWQGRLVYEPYLNGGVVEKGKWQTWYPIPSPVDNETTWYATGGSLKTTCTMANRCTLSQILALYPNIGLHGLYPDINFKAGGGWNVFDGNLDNVVITLNGTEQTFDFEPTSEVASTVYVDDNFYYTHSITKAILPLPLYSDPDGDGPATSMGFDASWTVQGAVDIVAPGGTVIVAEGTYTEQVIVRDLDGITIEGAGQDVVKITAIPNLVSTYTITTGNAIDYHKPVLFVGDSANVTVKELTLDGAGTGNTNNSLIGVFYLNSSGVIENVTATNMRHTPLGGDQGGIGFYIMNTDSQDRTVTARGSTAIEYQKAGFVFKGVGLTAIVDKNTATGFGETDKIAQNGIQIGSGMHGVLTRNTVTKHKYTGAGWASGGILVVDNSTANVSSNVVTDNMIGIAADLSTTTIERNYVSRNQWGIAVNGGEADIFANNITTNQYGVDVYTYNDTYTAVATVTHNRFYNNDFGVANEIAVAAGEVAQELYAVDNWWGCNEGPTNTVDCDGIYTGVGSQPVNATTWLELTLTADTTHVLNGSPADLLATLTINSADVDVSGTPGFPVGKSVLFATTLGEVIPVDPDLVDGSATSVLTVGPWANYETATVSVKLDNETVTLDLLAGLRHFWMPIIHGN